MSSHPRITTDTHRRCARCRAWKPHDAFARDRSLTTKVPRRYACRACLAVEHRLRRGHLSEDAYQQALARNNAGKRRQREAAMKQSIADAQTLYQYLRRQGLSNWAIEQLAGCGHGVAARIEVGDYQRRVPRPVLEKLQRAVDRVIGSQL
jgi:hypothetical protein